MNIVETLPANALYRGELTAATELGLDFEQPEGVDYLHAPLEVYRTKLEDGERFDVVVDHVSLEGKPLFGLLKEVAPNKGFDSIGGVLADWRIVDDARLPRNINDFRIGYAQRLVTIHEVMGTAWGEFMGSRRSFQNVLDDTNVPQFIRSYIAASLTTKEAALSKIKYDFAGQTKSITEFVDIFDKAAIPDAEAEIYTALASQVNRKRRKDSQIVRRDTLDKRFRSWSTGQKGELFTTLTKSYEEEVRNNILEQALKTVYDSIEFEDGAMWFHPYAKLQGISLQQAYDERQTVLRGGHAADVMAIPESDGTRDFLIPGTVRRIAPTANIAPSISWFRDESGKRTLNIERKTNAPGNQAVDGVLGAVAIAYFAPEERSDWPEKMRLRDGLYEQAIGVAQVPVLALMRRASLLKTDFVEACESVTS